uniref:Beta-adaptin appendage C-terminal subdomain domain-containing protein n=1 Tax=Naja naja TaxID=35670 RepID=A0A8C6XF08_NAJNA
MKMDPLNNLQVAVKNNIDVFYFSTLYPLYILFVEDGKMERQMFLATWKDIPNDNESQFQIKDCPLSAGETRIRLLEPGNIFLVRNVEGQDMLYQSLKLTNGICVLAELRIQPGPNFTVGLPLLVQLGGSPAIWGIHSFRLFATFIGSAKFGPHF